MQHTQVCRTCSKEAVNEREGQTKGDGGGERGVFGGVASSRKFVKWF